MKKTTGAQLVTILLAAAVCAAVILAGYRLLPSPGYARSHAGKPLKCVLDINRDSDPAQGLVFGYNYALLKAFAESMRAYPEIAIASEDEDWLDSLRAGQVDVVVVPGHSGSYAEGLFVSISGDNLTAWISAGRGCRSAIERWMKKFMQTEEYAEMRDSYFNVTSDPRGEAGAGLKRTRLSPYDDLFRIAADSLGWDDWRRFAAIAFQESKFHIEALSPRGAEGLMQLMPRTADRFGMENALDPEQSVSAGTEYLKRQQRIFRKYVLKEDLFHFTIAAYNAGEGNIRKCILYADSLAMFDGTWKSIREVMPIMGRDATLNRSSKARIGTYRYQETLRYVDSIDSLIAAFSAITPL